ncbi:lytic enzyme [Xanthomonas phage X2]|nr:lytic enzyme [Xanthomonas phage X2]
MSTETVAAGLGFSAEIAVLLEAGCIRYGLTSPLEKSHFLAQVAHESASGKWLEELASGKAYEGRKDLGNTQPGDGVRFKGRGLIQVTGRSNYGRYSAWQYGDTRVVATPGMLAQLPDAVDAAFWYWTVARPQLKSLALADDVVGVTKAINGGTNGLDDRKAKLAQAKRLFGLSV